MNRRKSKALRRRAEEYCTRAIQEAFPIDTEEVMAREEMWKMAFPETHYNRVCLKTTLDEDGDPETYKRVEAYEMSPRWIYKQLKKNPDLTFEQVKGLQTYGVF